MLAVVLDIRRWLAQDRNTPFAERLRRDRGIGRRLPDPRRRSANGFERVLGWWREIPGSASTGAAESFGERVAKACTLGSTALVVLGLVAGVAVSGAAFAYQGQYPVNLFSLLGLLVGVPLLLLLVTLLLLPARLPGLDGARFVLEGLNAGRWLGAWLDRYFETDLFRAFASPRARNAFARWQLLVFSQWFAVGFFIGALGLSLLLVTFTDLAFGWSTTLELGAERVHGWVSVVAAPWAAWWSAATPDLELVERSRYFRLDEARLPPEDVAVLGTWWPFVLATVLFYGLLPRLLFLGVCQWGRRVAVRRLLLLDPEVTALLDRLTAPLVSLEGSSEEDGLAPGVARLPGLAPGSVEADESLAGVIWNAAASETAAAAWAERVLAVRPDTLLGMSVLQTLEEQASLLGDLPEALRRVLVFTKGWEPPLLEFMDFLGLLRERVGAGCSITVVPLDISASAVEPRQRDVWARALGRLRDPALTVMDPVT